jgi:hypothetical protein
MSPREPRVVVVPARDDVERLQHRHAGLEHRRELPGEERDVLLRIERAAAQRLLLDLGDADALAAQVVGDDGFRRRRDFAADSRWLRSTPSRERCIP